MSFTEKKVCRRPNQDSGKYLSEARRRDMLDQPGYSLIKSFSEEVAGLTPTHGYPVVLARFDDAFQIGFLVERISEGRIVVFIPDAPNPWSGSVFILDEDRIAPLDAKPSAVVNCLKKLGAGAKVILKGTEC